MTATTTTKTEAFDKIWSVWENGLNQFYSTQQDLMNFTLDSIKAQKEYITASSKNMDLLESEFNTAMGELNKLYKENMKLIPNEEVRAVFETYEEKISDILSKMQKLAITPSKEMMDIIVKAQSQFESFVKESTKASSKNQEQTKSMIQSYLSLIHESQTSFMNLFSSQVEK